MSEQVPLRIPEHLIARAKSLVGADPVWGSAGSDWQPPPLRHAATIVLVRDYGDGPEVYLQRRVPTMAFAAGMFVFPGGAVDPIDITRAKAWVTAQQTLESAGGLPEFARRPADVIGEDTLAARFAAVREVSEEAGVDLGDEVALSMAYIAHWATPAVEDRRYDTRFYAVAITSSQHASQTSGESDQHVWISPKDALEQYGRGELLMLPPTVAVLGALSTAVDQKPGWGCQDVIGLLAREPIVPLMPHPVADPDQDGGLGWNLVDVRTEHQVAPSGSPPAGSEAGGIHTSLVNRDGQSA